MVWLYLVGLPAGILLLLLGLRRLLTGKPSRIHYARKDFLLSPEERQFFLALQSAVGEQFWIFPKIPVDRVITPRGRLPRTSPYARLEETTEALLPFLLVRKSDHGIAGALQLIEHRSRLRDRPPEPTLLKEVCQSAGLPLIRMESSPFYDEVDIRQAITLATRREPLFVSELDGRREPSLNTLEDLDVR